MSTSNDRRPRTRGERLAIGFGLTFPTLLTFTYFVALADAGTGWVAVAFSIGKAVQFAFPLIWVFGICRERVQWKPTWRGVPTGVAFGAAVFLAMLAVYAFVMKPAGLFVGPAAEVQEKGAQLGWDALPVYIAMSCMYSIVHSLFEEYYWRWFVFGRLRRQTGLGPAIAISSLGFMAHHVIVLGTYFGWLSLSAWLCSLGVAIGGAVWAWLYNRSGSLLGPWVSHALIDAAIFTIGYDLLRG